MYPFAIPTPKDTSQYPYPIEKPFEITEREKFLLTVMAYMLAEDLSGAVADEDLFPTLDGKIHCFQHRINDSVEMIQERINRLTIVLPTP